MINPENQTRRFLKSVQDPMEEGEVENQAPPEWVFDVGEGHSAGSSQDKHGLQKSGLVLAAAFLLGILLIGVPFGMRLMAPDVPPSFIRRAAEAVLPYYERSERGGSTVQK